jgi:hypothetical protein
MHKTVARFHVAWKPLLFHMCRKALLSVPPYAHGPSMVKVLRI